MLVPSRRKLSLHNVDGKLPNGAILLKVDHVQLGSIVVLRRITSSESSRAMVLQVDQLSVVGVLLVKRKIWRNYITR